MPLPILHLHYQGASSEVTYDSLVGRSCGTLSRGTHLWGTLASSKSNASSLQNERFVRQVLQTSQFKSPKWAFHARLPSNLMCQVCKTSVSHETSSKAYAGRPIGANTPSSPAKQFRDFSASKPHPPRCQSQMSQRHSPSTPQNPHKVLRLPHHTFGMISTRSEHTPIHQDRHFGWELSRKHTFVATAWDANPYATATPNTPQSTTLQTPIPIWLRRQLRISQNTAPAQWNHPPHFILSRFHTLPCYFTRIWHVMLPSKPSPKASPNVSAIAPYCERLRSLRQRVANKALPPRPPEFNENPSLRWAWWSGPSLIRLDTSDLDFQSEWVRAARYCCSRAVDSNASWTRTHCYTVI